MIYLIIYICLSRSKENGGAYDLGELDQALFLYLDGQDHPSSSIQDQRRMCQLSFNSFFSSQLIYDFKESLGASVKLSSYDL